MTERPILFSGPMVRALLAGTKTQTRRVVRWPAWASPERDVYALVRDRGLALYEDGRPRKRMTCPYGSRGDRLWVREAWRTGGGRRDRIADLTPDDRDVVHYRADDDEDPAPGCWRPSIHMPRWASRITLDVVSVRVERVQDISEEDARAEGVAPQYVAIVTRPAHAGILGAADHARETYRAAFMRLWDEINGSRPGCGWDDGPYVWVVTFRRITP